MRNIILRTDNAAYSAYAYRCSGMTLGDIAPLVGLPFDDLEGVQYLLSKATRLTIYKDEQAKREKHLEDARAMEARMLAEKRRIAQERVDAPKRRAKAVRLRKQGLTFKQIGLKLGGVTVERARQIVLKGIREDDKRRAAYWAHRTKSRPLDMGGPRGVWIVHTAESNYLEIARGVS